MGLPAFHIRFILSTKAGQGIASAYEDLIRQTYAGLPGYPEPEICYTQYHGHAAHLAGDWAKKWGPMGVCYVGGGDGTLNEVASVLQGTPCHMGAIPLGTGNDFCRTLYNNKKGDKLIKALIQASPYPRTAPIDMIRINENYCLNVTSLGYDTIVLRQAYDNLAKHPKLGQMAYGLAVLQSLWAPKSFELSFSLLDEQGREVQGHVNAATAVAGNGRFYGSGFQPTPHAELADGLGDFIFCDKLTFRQFLPLVFKYPKGKHLGSPLMHYWNFRELTLTSPPDKPFLANYDGVIFEADRIHLELLPGVLNFAFLTPEDQ